MQQSSKLSAPAKPAHDFYILPMSEVSQEGTTSKAKATSKPKKGRTLASIRKTSSDPTPKGLSDETHMALKYLSKDLSHLLMLQCLLTCKGEKAPEGFKNVTHLRNAVKHYKEKVKPRRELLARRIREHNAALARNAHPELLEQLRKCVAELE